MKITPVNIKLSALVEAFVDNDEEGVWAYDGKLNIRPPYQREFVYKPDQQKKVIETVISHFPLNSMYWAVSDKESGSHAEFEVIDGQQRTLSICKYISGDFAYKGRYFHNLQKDEQEDILNYELTIYQCTGTDSEKLRWFETINIAGEELTKQELRNAVYTGTWLSNAKLYFSKRNCPAYAIGKNYVRGSADRQEILETALKWIANKDGISIEDYMAQHQHDEDAQELWMYFQDVIHWIEKLFPHVRKEMKGQNWGELYNKYKDTSYNPNKLEEQIKELLLDDDVTKKSGIYPYLITGAEKYLSIRAFSKNQIATMYERQEGNCPMCKQHFAIDEMEADHITPWSKGGKTDIKNGQMLCQPCNRKKSNM